MNWHFLPGNIIGGLFALPIVGWKMSLAAIVIGFVICQLLEYFGVLK